MSKKKEILTRVLAKKKPGSNSISPVKTGLKRVLVNLNY